MIENPVIKNPIGVNKVKTDNQKVREILDDFWICCVSRETSLMARKEVLTGKAKFGITGDGKEVPQVAMARAFKKGDWRSGYYRDQTFVFALGLSTVEDFFAQLYADAENDPFSGGRQMNSHYATEVVDKEGEWTSHKDRYNISSDVSCTAGQMARAVGLALASKKYKTNPKLNNKTEFSSNGDEVCFVTIGDASTSEGVFWESINAACVEKIPMAVSVWDDGYGISVPIHLQTTKGSISKVLDGFRLDEKGEGMDIYVENGWDYEALCTMYEKGIEKLRKTHIPALFHIKELTQPQGHSTSGSHERYKSKERLQWEADNDCLLKMKNWIIQSKYATETEVEEIVNRARSYVKEARDNAWAAYFNPIQKRKEALETIYAKLLSSSANQSVLASLQKELQKIINPARSELVKNARQLVYATLQETGEAKDELDQWLAESYNVAERQLHTNLYSDSKYSALKVPIIPAKYAEDAPLKNGFQILNACFEQALKEYPNLYAFGEDVGNIGDVNQGFAGLQEQYGLDRVFDTGIREWTIMGQAIGMAMRGLRPIAEIQYLDYVVYGLEPLTDDLASLRYRTNGIQQAPAIIRTRGHRLEGIWHAGSPMGMLINSLRGIYICVPRNMTQAAGFYNTLLQSDDPAMVIESLNGYRLKERLPENVGSFTVPLGVPEVLITGTDVTLVTYGSCVRIAEAAIKQLGTHGISVELIDIQTLLPFDLEHQIVESLKKTNRILFLDEDVPGGATSYIMQEVLEVQGGYQFLDAAPKTLTAKAHRPPYGSDGDYFTKPNVEDIFESVYNMMHEADPNQFPKMF